jgi:hypothetical protein
MGLAVLNRAVVVLAREHNPTILHPSFLEAQGIVPKDWELAEPPMCTPPLSVVKYANGIDILVESNRLQILEKEPASDPAESSVPRLAAKYVTTLPHVRYMAVGVNCTAFAQCEKPETILIDRFVKEGSWNQGDLQMKAAGLRFVYEYDGGVFRLQLDPGKSNVAGTERPGIIVNGNYHVELGSGSSAADAETAIMRFADRYRHFVATAGEVVGLED